MAKCPKCGKEIKELNNIQQVYHSYPMKLNKKGEPVYGKTPRTWDSGPGTWACPECDQDLFDDEEAAIEFLKGGK